MSYPKTLETQISGKYDVREPGLLQLKRHLCDAGIVVRHPSGDEFVSQIAGSNWTFDVTKRSIRDVELDLFQSIRISDLHVVHNKFIDNKGYIGYSASIETAEAILYGKPIVALYPWKFSESASANARLILENAIAAVSFVRLDLMSGHKLLSIVRDICANNTRVHIKETMARMHVQERDQYLMSLPNG